MTGKQLKNSILQWAIQGKLVPQDPNDEPASVLLERIHTEKARLIKEKKIKKPKNESIIFRGDDNSHYEKFADGAVRRIDDEIPFEIPQSWSWCRFSELYISLTDGAHNTPKYTESGVPFISVKDMSSGTINFANTKFISEEEHKLLSSRCRPQKGDLLLSKVGSTGIPAIVTTDKEFSLFVSVALIKFNHNIVDTDYLCLLINSPLVQEQAAENTRGVGNKNWVLTAIANTLMVLPPLSEQKRIVERYSKLLPILETYSRTKAKIDYLNNSIFGLLKKTILQEAIHGKLVPQCSEDEPVSALLKRIKTEKERLIKEKKIKRDKTESVIFRGGDNRYYEQIGKDVCCIQDEIPFEIPDTWCWVRGKTAFLPMTSAKLQGDMFTYIDLDAVDNKQNIIAKPKRLRVSEAPSRASRELRRCDILFSMVRPYLRNIALVTDAYDGATASTGFYIIRASVGYNPVFLFWLMMSAYVVDGLNQFMKGDNSPSINNSHIEDWLYPLPPLEEQKRIAERIITLFEHLK